MQVHRNLGSQSSVKTKYQRIIYRLEAHWKKFINMFRPQWRIKDIDIYSRMWKLQKIVLVYEDFSALQSKLQVRFAKKNVESCSESRAPIKTSHL